MNTTSTAANVAVAVKMSTLLAVVKVANASENNVVNRITSPMRVSSRGTKNSTSTVMVGNADARTDPMTLLTRAILSSEYRR